MQLRFMLGKDQKLFQEQKVVGSNPVFRDEWIFFFQFIYFFKLIIWNSTYVNENLLFSSHLMRENSFLCSWVMLKKLQFILVYKKIVQLIFFLQLHVYCYFSPGTIIGGNHQKGVCRETKDVREVNQHLSVKFHR